MAVEVKITPFVDGSKQLSIGYPDGTYMIINYSRYRLEPATGHIYFSSRAGFQIAIIKSSEILRSILKVEEAE